MGVNVVSNTSLDIDASFTAFGVTAALSDFNISFATLTATVTDATFSVGSCTTTWSAEAEVGCSNYVPSFTLNSLTLGDQHPELRDFIAAIQEPLLDAFEEASETVVENTGLTWPFWSITAISVEGTDVVLHSAGDVTIDLDLKAGWNMVSVPVVPDNTAPSSVFAGNDGMYTWNPVSKSYVVPPAIEPDKGYWVHVVSDLIVHVTGAPSTAGESELSKGWNMAGSMRLFVIDMDDVIDTPSDSIVRSSIYEWNQVDRRYDSATVLQPGKGYWINGVRDCQISIP